eukprot:SAG31_NODE_18741_length_624_cov_1.247619_3_plen_40_part_01
MFSRSLVGITGRDKSYILEALGTIDTERVCTARPESPLTY